MSHFRRIVRGLAAKTGSRRVLDSRTTGIPYGRAFQRSYSYAGSLPIFM